MNKGNKKWLLTGMLINAFLLLIVFLSGEKEIYILILSLSLVLFIISNLLINKRYKFSRVTGIAASSIMVMLFIKGFLRQIFYPGGVIDLPTIMNIVCPFLYGYIIYILLFKENTEK